MFGSVLDRATGWLDQRLVSTVLMPLLGFWAGVGALLATHVGWRAVTRQWTELDPTGKVLVPAAAVAALVLLALLIQPHLITLVRAYEGYWMQRGWARPLGAAGLAIQRSRWRRLDLSDERDYAHRYRHFPPSTGDLLPTRLGTTMRAAEAYARDQHRYGMDVVFFWPRLFPLLPDPLRQSLSAARASLEQLLLTCTLAGVLGLVTAALAGPLRLPVAVWVPVLAGSAGLVLLAYRAAVAVAGSYGDLVRAAVDTHRLALLAAVGLTLPTTLEQERRLWLALGQQLYRRGTDHPEALTFKGPDRP